MVHEGALTGVLDWEFAAGVTLMKTSAGSVHGAGVFQRRSLKQAVLQGGRILRCLRI